jgi:hypothetical protein
VRIGAGTRIICTCASCGEEFESSWSDEEAHAERLRLFPGISFEQVTVVCDDCFKRINPMANNSPWAIAPGSDEPHGDPIEEMTVNDVARHWWQGKPERLDAFTQGMEGGIHLLVAGIITAHLATAVPDISKDECVRRISELMALCRPAAGWRSMKVGDLLERIANVLSKCA